MDVLAVGVFWAVRLMRFGRAPSFARTSSDVRPGISPVGAVNALLLTRRPAFGADPCVGANVPPIDVILFKRSAPGAAA